MENNNHKKRKVMLIAAFAVAVIALAGVGYAVASGYMATTVNSDNDATGVYFTAKQTGSYEAAFTPASEILINTYTDASNNDTTNTPLYTIDATPTPITAEDTKSYYGVQIGTASGLTINLSGATATGYTVSVKATGTLNGTTGHATDVWKYIVLIKDKYVVLDSNGTGSVAITGVGTAGEDQTVTVKLYIASEHIFDNYNTLVTPTSGYAGNATARVSPAADVEGTLAILSNVNLAFTFTV